MADMQLNPEEQADARRLFEAAGGGGGGGEGSRVCSFCGGIHMRACPRVAEFELHENGELKKVRFWPDGEWNGEFVIWPEMAFADEEDASAAG